MTFLAYDLDERRKKMHSDHRIINLRPLEGKSVKDYKGGQSKATFDGNNRLHAQFNHYTGLWKLNYDNGALPGGLQVLFTSFPELLDYVRMYFYKRNVEVIDVTDVN